MNVQQFNPGFKAFAKFLSFLFCIARVAWSWPEKTFDGFYFSITESIVLGVADGPIISCSDIVNSKRTVALNNNFIEFHFFGQFGIPPALFLVCCKGNVVITCRACEGKAISKLAGYHIPIFLFISQKIIPDSILSILRFGTNCYAGKHYTQ